MLQPLQLKDVSARYATEITELRHFLEKSGQDLGTDESLPRLTARLRDDRTFSRDLKSHVWVLLHADHPPLGYPDLLGILAIAAAGPVFAAAADDTDAHHLLRFLMDARRSFDTVPAARTAAIAPVGTMRPSPIVPFPSSSIEEQPLFTRHILPQAVVGEQNMARKMAILVGAATALLAAFAIGLWLHRSSTADHANTTTPIAQGSGPSASLAQNQADPPILRTDSSVATLNHTRPATHTSAHRSPQPALSLPAADYHSVPQAKPTPLTPVTATPQPLTHPTPRTSAPPRNTLAANAGSPHLLRRQPAPTPSKSSKDASSLIARVQPIDLGTAPEDNPSSRSYTTRAATVRPTSLGIMAANVTYSPAPAYPSAASAAHVQGEVKLEAEVDPDGNVSSARVISGPPLLREAAANAVEHWHYRPYVADGKPISMSALIVMDFQLP